jgi:CheY-like chemotaxis protein
MQVRGAEDGIEALALVHQQEPDLIVLDLQLPRMDGRQFLTQLRYNTGCREIPVVVTSAAYNVTKASLKELDVQAFVAKPFDLDELLDTIEELSRSALLSRRH